MAARKTRSQAGRKRTTSELDPGDTAQTTQPEAGRGKGAKRAKRDETPVADTPAIREDDSIDSIDVVKYDPELDDELDFLAEDCDNDAADANNAVTEDVAVADEAADADSTAIADHGAAADDAAAADDTATVHDDAVAVEAPGADDAPKPDDATTAAGAPNADEATKPADPDDARPSRRSTRKRAAADPAPSGGSDASRGKARARGKARTAAAPRPSKKWDPDHLVTSRKSALAARPAHQLAGLLADPRAWECLAPAQQRRLLALLPPAPSERIADAEAALLGSGGGGGGGGGEGGERPLPNVLRQRLARSEAWQSDVRQFQDDLAAGWLDPEWLAGATLASERRARGEFDDFKAKERQWEWRMWEEE
jgi:hypothetical protein